MSSQDELRLLQRIAVAIERLLPEPPEPINIKNAESYVWDAAKKTLIPISETTHVPLEALKGIDEAKEVLIANTRQFARGYSANSALLWGASGMGKSALIKSVHAAINEELPKSLVLVEISAKDLATLPALINALRGWVIRRFIIFCDDIGDDAALKAALDGGIEGKPEHILFYATSAKENILAPHFGLQLAFQPCDEDTYWSMIEHYIRYYRLAVEAEEYRSQASEWAISHNERSGRVAWQFIHDLAGKMGKRILL